jgi:monodehydroascorbate reductase (NADH)
MASAAAQCFSYSSSPATWALQQRGGGSGAGVLRLSSRRTFSVSAAAVFDNQNREWVTRFSSIL